MAKELEHRVAELEKIVKQLQGKAVGKIGKKLGVGDTFTLAGLEWTILEITDVGYMCLAERLENSMQFDSHCNNWAASDLRNYLNTTFLDKLVDTVGGENVIKFDRNLLSLDGQTEYRGCEDKVSLLNVDEYRKYRALIPNADYWWWLITPWSTPCNGYDATEAVVSPRGYVDGSGCNCNFGVRPFCIFSSSIFESEE